MTPPSLLFFRLSDPAVSHNAVMAVLLKTVHALDSLLRLAVLSVLFAPVLATAYLAMQLDICRPLWLQLFRYAATCGS